LATLAAVLIFIATRILHIHDLIDIARYDRFEFGLALITLFTVALVAVEQGIAVAVALAILDRTRLSARPHMHVLGCIPSTTSWGARRHRTRHRGSRGTRGAVRDTPLVRQRRSFQD
jgi:sulfate permease, SulP family